MFRLPWYHWSRLFGPIVRYYNRKAELERDRNSWRCIESIDFGFYNSKKNKEHFGGFIVYFMKNSLDEKKLEMDQWGLEGLKKEEHKGLLTVTGGWTRGLYSDDDIKRFAKRVRDERQRYDD